LLMLRLCCRSRTMSTRSPYTTLFRSGRTDMPPVIINPAQSQHFSLAFAGQGAVQYQFVDQHGVASPAQVSFYQNGKLQLREYTRSEEHTSELQSRENLVCRLLLEKKN